MEIGGMIDVQVFAGTRMKYTSRSGECEDWRGADQVMQSFCVLAPQAGRTLLQSLRLARHQSANWLIGQSERLDLCQLWLTALTLSAGAPDDSFLNLPR